MSDYDCGIKRFRIESLVRLSPLPLPRTARVAYYDRLRYSVTRAAAAPVFRAAVPYCVGAGVPDGPHRRTAEYRRTLVYPSVGAGVPDGPRLFRRGSGHTLRRGRRPRRPVFHAPVKGIFRALERGSLLATAPKVTKNAA